MKSTDSFINGDEWRSLDLPKRLGYLIYNFKSNFFEKAYNVPKNLFFLNSFLQPLEKLSICPGFNLSPARFFSNAFWISFPWNNILDSLGRIRLLDIGCGNGEYFFFFNCLLGENLESYTGIDIKSYPEWKRMEKYRKADFYKIDAEDYFSHPKEAKFNFIVSQFALEHIRNDLKIFYDIKHWMKENPLIQVHMLPGESSLFLYLWHGWRQYNLAKIVTISSIFHESKIYVITLGGSYSCIIHPLWMIKEHSNYFPLWIRKLHDKIYSRFYEKLVRWSYQLEYNREIIYPIVYSLIITSNVRIALKNALQDKGDL